MYSNFLNRFVYLDILIFSRSLSEDVPCLPGTPAAAGEQIAEQIPLHLCKFFGIHHWEWADEGRSRQDQGSSGEVGPYNKKATSAI